MNTIRQLAMQWFNPLSSAEKTRLVDTNPELFGGVRRWETLTGSEIENIFYNEVIVKWWDSLDASKMGDFLYHLRDGMDSMEEVTKAEICTLYIKEHSKEEPYINKGLDYMIDLEQPLSVNKDVEVDEEKTYPCIKCNKLRTKAEGGTTFSVCDDCWNKPKVEVDSWNKPKVEVDSWNEAQKEYHKLYSVKSVSGLDILSIPQRHLFKWLEQHYTLTKKQ
jgi:hypothetical protein